MVISATAGTLAAQPCLQAEQNRPRRYDDHDRPCDRSQKGAQDPEAGDDQGADEQHLEHRAGKVGGTLRLHVSSDPKEKIHHEGTKATKSAGVGESESSSSKSQEFSLEQ
jgi:hypothetical protein